MTAPTQPRLTEEVGPWTDEEEDEFQDHVRHARQDIGLDVEDADVDPEPSDGPKGAA